MPVSNGSGHDVEYDVEEGDPPPQPLIMAPKNALRSSVALTGGGAAFMIFGCLPQIGNPLLTLIGATALGVAIGIQVTVLIAGRRRRRGKRERQFLKACSTVPYTFNFGDRVVFYERGTPDVLARSESVIQSDAVVELKQVTTLGGAPDSPPTFEAVIHGGTL